MPMPPPPPPGPPLPPGLPAPPAFTPAKSKGGSADNRGALLQSIRQGTKLKKAVTVDKSAPMIAGRVSGSNTSSNTNSSINNDNISRTKPTAASSNNQAANGLALGGLFAGGMPKLRPTGLRTGANQSSSNHVSDNARKPTTEATRQNSVSPVANSNHLNEVLRRQLAGDIRNRGPPPQPPSSRNNTTTDSTDTWNTTTRSVFNNKINSVAPSIPVQSSLYHNKNNNSFLHQTSNTSGSVVNVPNNIAPPPPKPISHGKPNVAPKPPPNIPASKPATPPKKLVMNGRVPVSRAQSMRVPRSPPVAPPSTPPFPPAVNGKDFGTIRGVPSAFHQSQENLSHVKPHHHRNQTLPVNLIKSNAPPPPPSTFSHRPNVRPPVPPPPSKTGSNINLKAPLSPPPPPPTSAPPPPPPPPHRTSPAPPPPPPSHTRPPPAIPTNGPPPPPVRNSSMRNGSFDFDTRFSNLFHPVSDLAAPIRFRGFTKIYSSKNAVNKQQAPLPPNSVQLGNKLWESSTC